MANRIDFIIGAKDGASKKLGLIQRSVQSIGPAVTGVAAAWLSWRSAKSLLDSTIISAAKQEEIFRKLQTAVELTGASYEKAKPTIDGFLRSMQDTTRYGDEVMAETMQTIISLTGSVNSGLEGSKVAADLASTGLFDLNTAARFVAMAMAGNVQMLGRYIPELRASSGLIDANATATEKWAIAKQLINDKFGGSAAADLQTAIGQWERFKNELGDTGQSVGDILLPSMTGLAKVLGDIARTVNEGNTTWDKFLGLISGLGMAMDGTLGITRAVDSAIAKTTAHIDEQNKKIEEAAFNIVPQYTAAWGNLVPAIDDATDSIDDSITAQEFFAQTAEDQLNTLAEAWLQQERAIKDSEKAMTATNRGVKLSNQEVWQQVTTGQRIFGQALQNSMHNAINNIVDQMFKGGLKLREIFANMAKDFIKFFIQSALQALADMFVVKVLKYLGGLFDTYQNDMMAARQGADFANWFIHGANETFVNNPWGPQIAGSLNYGNGGAVALGPARVTQQTIINIYGDNYDETSLLKKIEGAVNTGRSKLVVSKEYYNGQY